jgi:multidrug resistance efflux pump
MRRIVLLYALVALATAAFRLVRVDVGSRRPTDEHLEQRSAASGPTTSAPAPLGYFGVLLSRDVADVEPSSAARIERIFVKPGQLVAAGALIAVLDDRAEERELEAARAAESAASARLRRLLAAEATSGDADANFEIEAAQVDVAKKGALASSMLRHLASTHVVAPFPGTVTRLYVTAGAMAVRGRPIVRVVGQERPCVRFAVPEGESAGVLLGTTVDVFVGSPPVRIPGSVVRVAPDEGVQGFVLALATLSIPEGLDPRLTTNRSPGRVFRRSDEPISPPP